MLRRKFLKDSAGWMSALPLVYANPLSLFNSNILTDNEVVRKKIGDINCIIFRDYMYKYLAKDFFINVSQDELKPALDEYHINPDNIPSPFIAMLLQSGDKKILIDTGIGFSDKPVSFRGNTLVFKGGLNRLLDQENIKKDEITDVVITHFHPDHVGGIFGDDSQLNFPNATFHVHETEWNYWHSAESDHQPELFKIFIEKNIKPLKKVNLQIFNGEHADLAPGIRALEAFGHTPGHITLDIHSGNDHLLYIADAFLHPLHIEHLNWETNYDLDHQNAKESRIRLLEMAYHDNMLVNAFHFDFPGLGRIDKMKDHWKWVYSEK
jgi:glyoxylase-like metal-dependent hydrolase (beta-lactamase superfamily II)